MTAAKFDRVVGANIQRHRTLLAISQAQLAEHMTERGFPMQQQTILKIEKGGRPLRLNEALAMADCLKIDIQDVGDADEERSQERGRLNRARAMCEEILNVAVKAVAMDDKLTEMLSLLRDLVENERVDIIGSLALEDPKVQWFAGASNEDVRELASGPEWSRQAALERLIDV